MAKGEVIILGCGLIGTSIALDFLTLSTLSKVTVVDVSDERLRALEQRASKLSGLDPISGSNARLAEKLHMVNLDIVKKRDELLKLFQNVDLGIGALPYGIADEAVQSAVEAGISFVDLIYSWHYERSSSIDAKAKQKGITIVPACGLAPGLTNILAKYAADQMEDIDAIRINVGGIPEVPKQPMNYKIVFAVESVLEEYTRDALVVRDGKKMTVPAMSELDELAFEDLPEQKFESFITDGLSTLPETVKKVKLMEEKTIRWKGHADQVKLLMDLGFFSERPVNLKTTGARVSPKGLLTTLLDKKLAMHQGDKDMTLLRVEVKGRKKKGDRVTRIHKYEMIDHFDSDTQTTSMARTTAFPCSTVGQMILEGKITERGFIPPELAIKDDRFDDFISRLERKGLSIREREYLADSE
ncbi:MAG: saccharopine dehydrogenase NADP-binding domain-containing protein [Nitrososphaerota archaeon]|nr:saccharopine dehydrogenase NADP-binding domain-containing protein [Nitrososphaerota archaeon]